ncbi:MAG: fructose-1,6-bisphosphatase [Anaerolineales bacterium]|jgi:fructose-1,6-bisphosphatase-3
MSIKDLDYLKLLSKQYPNIRSASSEIINLSASLHLPKGTEHFLSDIHGEYESFSHLLRSGSGSVKRKIDELFQNEMTELERQELATMIYYPGQKLSLMVKALPEGTTVDWYRVTLFRLVRLTRAVSSKYARSTLRRAFPPQYADIIEELLHEQETTGNRYAYYRNIIDTIISIGSAQDFITALAELIQRLEIAHLHILGDIYDRSAGAHLIMDALMEYHSVDITWGNHDIVWMGAAAGSEACMANVIRVSLRYVNLQTLENGYALSLLPLASFAMETYHSDPCSQFAPRVSDDEQFTEHELRLMAQMHKAISVIQWKLEAQIILRRPQYRMQDRLLMDKINFEAGTVQVDGCEYPLLDTHFPTVDPENPYELTSQEQNVVDKLHLSFTNSEKLQRHLRFLLAKGSLYLIYNGNLLYHGCIPMNADGTFAVFEEGGQQFYAREFMDHLERLVRQGCLADDPEQKQAGLDAMWYLWGGAQSPIFGKAKMATFERYLIADKTTHKELMNPYYDFRDQESTACKILAEFGLDEHHAHIVNGHVPVKVKRGESPVKAGGRLFVIDGGLAKAYQSQTGIAGYTLVYNSYGLLLASHDPFESVQQFIESSAGPHPKTTILETNYDRIRVQDTDQGKRIAARIDALQALLDAYRTGTIKEAL